MQKRLGAMGWRRILTVIGALAVVGVLGAGSVLAQSPTPNPTTTAAPIATHAPAHRPAPILGRLATIRARWIRGAQYATVTVKTKTGFETLEYVRGEVTAVGSDTLTVTAADSTAFSIDVTSATRIRNFRRKVPFSAVQDGQHAIVLALKNSDGSYTARFVLVWPVKAATAPAPTPTPTPTA